MESEKEAVTRILFDYYSAFSELDPQAITPYCNVPILFIGSQGVFAATTHDTMVAAFTTFMEGLRKRGFGRSELSGLTVKLLGANTALAAGIATRYTADGQELDRLGVTYLMQKADSRWKIAVNVIHDTDHASAG